MIYFFKMNFFEPRVMCQSNTVFSQLRGMYQPKHHLFISKRYVPIRNWNNTRSHILYTISTCFLFGFNLSNLLCLKAILILEESYYIFPPSPPKLLSSNFSMATTHLQFVNIYFIMAKIKFIAMVTQNILKTMIEYILISNILDRICKMI